MRGPATMILRLLALVGKELVEDWEGCLSIPDVRGRVPRAREVKVRALDRTGARIELSAHDFPARVIQHETDHLNGIVFGDRLSHKARKKLDKQMQKAAVDYPLDWPAS